MPLVTRTAALLAATTLVLACSDASSPTPPADDLSPSPSATVERFTEPAFDVFVDEEQGLSVLWGISHEQPVLGCAGEEDVAIDSITVLAVTRPDGSVKLTIRAKNVNLTVYEVASFDSCGVLAQTTPLAIGAASISQTDNDLFVSLDRTNSFRFALVGKAASPQTGQRFHVKAGFHALINRDGELRLTVEGIALTPVGG